LAVLNLPKIIFEGLITGMKTLVQMASEIDVELELKSLYRVVTDHIRRCWLEMAFLFLNISKEFTTLFCGRDFLLLCSGFLHFAAVLRFLFSLCVEIQA